MPDLRRRSFITLLGGAAAAWPFAAQAQQAAMPVVGFMSARSPEDTVQELNAFYKGLDEGGFIDRRNVGHAATTRDCRNSPPNLYSSE